MGLEINPLRQSVVIPHNAVGVCLWEVDGKYLADGENSFLSLEGLVNDRRVEEKMRVAAYYWLGERIGKPVWVAGARKISSDEYDDQMERLQSGKIPDPLEEIRQIKGRKK